MRLCCKTSWKALLRFKTTHEKKLCKTGSKLGGKTCNISNQLVLQKCCKSSSTLFLALYRDRKSHRMAHFLLWRVLIFAILVVSFTNHKNSKALHQPPTNKEQRYSDVGSHVFLRPISVRILNAICKNRTN